MFNRRYWRFWLLLALLLLSSWLLVRSLRQANELAGRQYESETLMPPYEHKSMPIPFITTMATTQRTRDLHQLLNCKNNLLEYQRLQYSDYWLLQNVVVGKKSLNINCAASITYTTNGDFTFFDNLETVVQHWLAPISFAVFAPGHDMNATLDAIQYVRNCLPDSQLISDYVSFHIYFPNEHMPQYVPRDEQELLSWPYSCLESNGSLAKPPYAQVNRNLTYKVQNNLTYPINVGRNIARKAANTHFILACDIELYPSLGFVDQFLDMVANNNSVLALDESQAKRVYPLAVFEVGSNETVPSDKSELLKLFHGKRAQFFHASICASCHRLPGQRAWVERDANATDELEVFSVGLRKHNYRSWEPFYVSDNSEPFFDERVTWEGQSNKRIQGYAMCLLGYEYHVLHPAFLVHSPGFKQKSERSHQRIQAAIEMTRFIKSKIEPEYQVLFGMNGDCET